MQGSQGLSRLLNNLAAITGLIECGPSAFRKVLYAIDFVGDQVFKAVTHLFVEEPIIFWGLVILLIVARNQNVEEQKAAAK